MARTKFVLTANPTFKAKVNIPIPGASPEAVEFTFKHRTKDEYLDWAKNLEGKDEVDMILEMASGWELADPFDRESIEKLTQSYLGSARAIFEKYVHEQTNAKLGN
jgi:hypothetical protein